jgi:hypothetical protein
MSEMWREVPDPTNPQPICLARPIRVGCLLVAMKQPSLGHWSNAVGGALWKSAPDQDLGRFVLSCVVLVYSHHCDNIYAALGMWEQ